MVELYAYRPEYLGVAGELAERAADSDPPQLAETRGRVAAAIGSVPVSADAPSLAGGAAASRDEFREQHARAVSGGRALSEAAFRSADDAMVELERAGDVQMTHGGLSFDNLLRRRDGG